MASTYTDLKTLNFLLFEVFPLEKILQAPYFEEAHDKESTELFLNAIKDFSDRELFPYFKEMDEKPAVYENGTVKVHEQVKVYMEKAGELGLLAAPFKFEDGGLQLPLLVQTAAAWIQDCANNHLPSYGGLTLGAAELIIEFGSDYLKTTYAAQMLTGAWGGTMCLTEPQAGSSLSDVVTRAVKDEDHYKISGQKIFISGGEYHNANNIVHLVLARIDGAPAGTKGISLFVVPKKRVDASGKLVDNDVLCVGDFQKMGQKGYCTTHLAFGEKNDCRGWLVGKEHKGLQHMFLMMNGARIGVGRGAAAITMAASCASWQYANERPQGRRLLNNGKKDLSAKQTLIINHPDVKRMLLNQKAIAEGALSLVLKASYYADRIKTARTTEEIEKYKLLLEIIIPVVKTYPSEMGLQAVSQGLQVLGGYGYCTDFILQQYYRDIRIFSIYEGTTGIHGLDLLGRKVNLSKGRALNLYLQAIKSTIDKSLVYDELKPYGQKLDGKLDQLKIILNHLMPYAQKGAYENYLADATLFLDFFGHLTTAWLWLEMAEVAKNALIANQKKYIEDFYTNKINLMRFYFKYELPKTTALAETLLNPEFLTVKQDLKEKI